jgi:flagellar hook-basal body complex protein FliE
MDDLRIGNIQKASSFVKGSGVKQKASTDFGTAIKEAVEKVNRVDKEADRSVIDLLQEKADIHETMIALQKADISMRLFLAIRNKVIDAYKEIMHMQF